MTDLDNHVPLTNREIALDHAVRLAMQLGVGDAGAIVDDATAFLGFLDAGTAKLTGPTASMSEEIVRVQAPMTNAHNVRNLRPGHD